MATVALSSRNAEVTARPNPPVPPATRTTLPENLPLISIPPGSLTIKLQQFGHHLVIRGGPVTLRFARGVWRRGRSSPSDGWRLTPRRCRHGSIRKTKSSRANEDRFERDPSRRRRGGGRSDRAKKYEPGGAKFPQKLAIGQFRSANG